MDEQVIYEVDGKKYLIIRDRYLTADELVDVARKVGVIE